MEYHKYFVVKYQDRVRFETVSKDEAENYARALFAKAEEKGEPPVIDEHLRSQ